MASRSPEREAIWDERVRQWEPLLWRLAARFRKDGEWINGADPEDLVQEGRIQLWGCYRDGRPTNVGYIARCAFNAMHDWVYRTLDKQHPTAWEYMIHIEDGSLEHELYASDLTGELVLGR